MKRKALLLWLLGISASALVACESQGPFEQAGEEIDETIQDAEEELEDLRD